MSWSLMRSSLVGLALVATGQQVCAREFVIYPTHRPAKKVGLAAPAGHERSLLPTVQSQHAQLPNPAAEASPAELSTSLHRMSPDSSPAEMATAGCSASCCGVSHRAPFAGSRVYDPRTCGHKIRATHPICNPCQMRQFGYVPTCWSLWPEPPSYDHCPCPNIPQLPQDLISQYGSPLPKPASPKSKPQGSEKTGGDAPQGTEKGPEPKKEP
jgi:hypothetical protein